MATTPIVIFWFRRDLRIEDNAGLYHALKSGYKVLPIFIFDKEILSKLGDKHDRRVDFIHQAIHNLQAQLLKYNSTLHVWFEIPSNVFTTLLQQYTIKAVYTNADYEPNALLRDSAVEKLLQLKGTSFHSYKDQCIFEKSEVVKDDGKPYTIFTPYSNKWKRALNDFYLRSYPTEKYTAHFLQQKALPIPSLKDIGFEETDTFFSKPQIDETIIQNYKQQRDFPAIKGTSRLSVHLRFGTVSIRQLARIAMPLSEAWLNELIWRDFYFMIMCRFPHSVDNAFKPTYDRIPWRNNEEEFNAWCNGQTGYPIVDAGMRELNATGFMHNRVRMIVASFLTKHLLIDWRWGERYFAGKLLDFDLSANVGGWQWAASSGCDAAPYFRVFNPYEQTKKFDSQLRYIRKWVPELDSISYPKPIVDHAFARERVLRIYKSTLGQS